MSKRLVRWDQRLQIQKNLFMAFKRGSPMEITLLLSQQYNVGEKPTVILHTYYIVITIKYTYSLNIEDMGGLECIITGHRNYY